MKRFLGALNHLPETRLAGIQGFPASGGNFHVSEKRVSGSLSFDLVQVAVLGFVPLGQTPDKDVVVRPLWHCFLSNVFNCDLGIRGGRRE